jgi:hypothetical protein
MDEHLKALLDFWPHLSAWQRSLIWLRVHMALLPRPPVAGPKRMAPLFALRAIMIMFGLLFILPHHPLSIPITFGSGLAFALITH